jgi:hypothetical protein
LSACFHSVTGPNLHNIQSPIRMWKDKIRSLQPSHSLCSNRRLNDRERPDQQPTSAETISRR